MKRRRFALMAGSSALALSAVPRTYAQTSPPSSLGAGLTPLGSEQAGNADGSIPPWTGGMTTMPPGIAPDGYVPELFPDEQPVIIIDSSNLADHASLLSDGVKAMITKYGQKLKVYPTHRTASAPQYIYDNSAKNLTTSSFTAKDPAGGRFGFQGAYGGVPFPVPDVSNPSKAGAQIIWNHLARWIGFAFTCHRSEWAVSSGRISLAAGIFEHFKYPYYDPKGSLETFDGKLELAYVPYDSPATLVGQVLVVWYHTNPYLYPQAAWEYLNGQGRVRRAPEVSFDTPSSQSNGIIGYDENYGFNGSIERYDWKYLGKQEMYIPYNNNGLYAHSPQEALLPHFVNPDLVRWEKHRCWVIEATLHPGERNVLARRRFYVDEDTWAIGYGDCYDAHDNLFKVNIMYNYCRPDMPCLTYGLNSIHNLQTDEYVAADGFWNQNERATLKILADIPDSIFDPENLAARAQY